MVPTAVLVVALAAVSAVGLTLAATTPAPMSIIVAILTVMVAALLALRLRRAPAWAPVAAIFATGMAIVTVALPITLVLTDHGRSSTAYAADDTPTGSASPVADPSAELSAALDQADRLLAGGSNSLLTVDIDEHSTRVSVLDLAAGQSITAYRSQSDREWGEPSRNATNDRANATFRRADVAKLNLTDTARRVTAAADQIKLDRTHAHASDGIEIGRRSADKLLVAEFSMSGNEMESDASGALPDNLALAQVTGMLPVADRLLRANGIDPTKRVISELTYRAVGENTASVGSANDQGTVEIQISGGTKTGRLTETVGRFPVVQLNSRSGSNSDVFALPSISPAAIERARADVVRRFAVPAIDAQALALEVDRDMTSPGWMSGTLPPIMTVKLGPGSSNEAKYHLDGSFFVAE